MWECTIWFDIKKALKILILRYGKPTSHCQASKIVICILTAYADASKTWIYTEHLSTMAQTNLTWTTESTETRMPLVINIIPVACPIRRIILTSRNTTERMRRILIRLFSLWPPVHTGHISRLKPSHSWHIACEQWCIILHFQGKKTGVLNATHPWSRQIQTLKTDCFLKSSPGSTPYNLSAKNLPQVRLKNWLLGAQSRQG